MNDGAKKIFIIDDDMSVYEILSDYLKLSDFEVKYNLNPKKALDELQNFVPDLILLDLNMPEMNGFEVLKAIRSSDNLKNVPVILLTSHDHINYKIKGLEEGADDYITKPFQKAEVLARIRAILRRTEKISQKKEIKEDDLLKGDLSNFTLVDLLQFFDINKKSGRIKLLDIFADIYISNGCIVNINYKNFDTVEALKRLLLFSKGKFEVDFNYNLNYSENTLKISDLLLDLVSFSDELKRDLSPEFKENSILKILDKELFDKFNIQKEEIGVLELLSIFPYDLKEGIWVLKNLLENKRISIKDDVK